MQGNEYFTSFTDIDSCKTEWLRGRDAAVKSAKLLNEKKVSKQICNRILEPYLMHTVLVTGHEWENFFALREHPDAEIHIRELAHKMLIAYNDSTPKILEPGEWHIPFGDMFDKQRLYNQIEHDHGIYDPVINDNNENTIYKELIDKWKVKIATARCARTSYLNFEGKDDYEADIKLHEQLLGNEPIHASPAEHCAQTMDNYEYYLHERRYLVDDKLVQEFGWLRNFKGFKQYRTMLKNDTAKDSRVIKK